MEIRARYILMGAFLLAVIGAVFGFVYWLNNTGGFGERAVYRIRFESSVSGLFTGAAVLFNGIRVGEVTGLYLRADNPSEVDVTIKVDPQTPIRADTLVDLDFQGLTGVAAISLNGGSAEKPLPPSDGMPPVLMAKSSAGVSITQSARDALLKLNGILSDNSQPLKELVGNINTFSGALARNSDKVDGILSGLERMTGGARGKDSDKAFDLAAPRSFEKSRQALARPACRPRAHRDHPARRPEHRVPRVEGRQPFASRSALGRQSVPAAAGEDHPGV